MRTPHRLFLLLGILSVDPPAVLSRQILRFAQGWQAEDSENGRWRAAKTAGGEDDGWGRSCVVILERSEESRQERLFHDERRKLEGMTGGECSKGIYP